MLTWSTARGLYILHGSVPVRKSVRLACIIERRWQVMGDRGRGDPPIRSMQGLVDDLELPFSPRLLVRTLSSELPNQSRLEV